MQDYLNGSGDSGVSQFELGEDFIRVLFKTGGQYRYTKASAGVAHILTMRRLAIRGIGLCTYISREKPPYAEKEQT